MRTPATEGRSWSLGQVTCAVAPLPEAFAADGVDVLPGRTYGLQLVDASHWWHRSGRTRECRAWGGAGWFTSALAIVGLRCGVAASRVNLANGSGVYGASVVFSVLGGQVGRCRILPAGTAGHVRCACAFTGTSPLVASDRGL